LEKAYTGTQPLMYRSDMLYYSFPKKETSARFPKRKKLFSIMLVIVSSTLGKSYMKEEQRNERRSD
jgi:hypothetical protein